MLEPVPNSQQWERGPKITAIGGGTGLSTMLRGLKNYSRNLTAVVTVADNGEGIPPDRADTIFDPFVVGSDARSGSGSGLGLAITRRIVEKHGGSIRLENRPAPGRTTEFVILLPLCP